MLFTDTVATCKKHGQRLLKQQSRTSIYSQKEGRAEVAVEIEVLITDRRYSCFLQIRLTVATNIQLGQWLLRNL